MMICEDDLAQNKENMKRKQGDHLKRNKVKIGILEFVLQNGGHILESKIREFVENSYDIKDQKTVNTHLHDLKDLGCLERFSLKRGLPNYWGIETIKNLEQILEEYSDLIETLQNSEHALNIVLDALEEALISSTNPKKTDKYKEYDEIKVYLASIRENLSVKLKMSSAFFELCIRDEYSLYRNVTELMEISDDRSRSHAFIADDFKFFVNSTSGIDVAFKACVALDIMGRKGNIRKDMKNEIEYVKEMKNAVPEKQLKQLKEYYEKTRIAPVFIKDTKFVSVNNSKLSKLQTEFEKRSGKWDYLKDDKEPEGSA